MQILYQWIQPPTFTDESKTRSARLLFGFFGAMAVSINLMVLLVMFIMPQAYLRWSAILLVLNLSLLILILIARKGFIHLAGLLSIFIVWGITVALAVTAGGMRAAVLTLFPVIIFLSGSIFGHRGSIGMALICALTGLGILSADEAGLLPSDFIRHPSLTYWLVNAGAGFIAAALQIVSTRFVREASKITQESERRLEMLLSNLQGIAYRCRNDRDRTMEFLSGGCRVITGYPPDDLLRNASRSFGSLIHPDDSNRVWEEIQDSVSHAVPFRLTYRIQTADGRTRWMWEQGQGTFDSQNQLLALEGFISDISEQKQAEEFLLHQAAQLDLLNQIGGRIGSMLDVEDLLKRAAKLIHESFEYHHVGIFLVDDASGDLIMKAKAGLYTEAFPEDHRLKSGQGMVGWSGRQGKFRLAMDVLTDPFFVNLHPDRIPTRSELSVPILFGGRTLGVLDIQSPTPGDFDQDDIIVMETLASQLAVAIENARLYEAMQQELAERERTEILLRESEDRYREFVANTTEGIWRVEPEQPISIELPEREQIERILDCRVVECNNALAHMLGFNEAAEVIGTPLRTLPGPPGEVRPDILESFLKSGHRISDAEFQEPDRNGGVRWFTGSLVGLIEQGRLLRIWGIRIDITGRKQQEVELGAIASLSAMLRTATTRAEMLPVIEDQLVYLFSAECLTIEFIDFATGESVVEYAWGGWKDLAGMRIPAGQGLNALVASTGKPYVDNNVRLNSAIVRPDLLGESTAAAGAPLIARGKIIGYLWVARAASFAGQDVRVMNAVADIAASALYRANLFEQIERNLQRMAALHEIDSAISSTLDLKVSLSILIGHMIRQMNLDAAAVLLRNPVMPILEYAAGQGFRDTVVLRKRIHIGEGLAGRAALDRKPVKIGNLADAEQESSVRWMEEEGFAAYHAVPLIAKGQVQGVLEVYHRRPFKPDTEWFDFLDTIAGQAAIAIDNAQLLQQLQRANTDLFMAYDETIEGWSSALDLRDKETEGHTQRVTAMTLRLADELRIPAPEIAHLRRGALLHDIGKMGVPDSILLKPGKLTKKEQDVMAQHPVFAYQLLSPIRYLRQALDIPYAHHEKWDGTGYPRGLRGEDIPLAARLFTVVDVWDAIVHGRPYSEKMNRKEAVNFIRSQSGSHFDPSVVDVFLKLVESDDPVICQGFLEGGG